MEKVTQLQHEMELGKAMKANRINEP